MHQKAVDNEYESRHWYRMHRISQPREGRQANRELCQGHSLTKSEAQLRQHKAAVKSLTKVKVKDQKQQVLREKWTFTLSIHRKNQSQKGSESRHAERNITWDMTYHFFIFVQEVQNILLFNFSSVFPWWGEWLWSPAYREVPALRLDMDFRKLRAKKTWRKNVWSKRT